MYIIRVSSIIIHSQQSLISILLNILFQRLTVGGTATTIYDFSSSVHTVPLFSCAVVVPILSPSVLKVLYLHLCLLVDTKKDTSILVLFWGLGARLCQKHSLSLEFLIYTSRYAALHVTRTAMSHACTDSWQDC